MAFSEEKPRGSMLTLNVERRAKQRNAQQCLQIRCAFLGEIIFLTIRKQKKLVYIWGKNLAVSPDFVKAMQGINLVSICKQYKLRTRHTGAIQRRRRFSTKKNNPGEGSGQATAGVTSTLLAALGSGLRFRKIPAGPRTPSLRTERVIAGCCGKQTLVPNLLGPW